MALTVSVNTMSLVKTTFLLFSDHAASSWSTRAAVWSGGEVQIRLPQAVEVIGVSVQCHVSDHLGELFVRQPSISGFRQNVIRHGAAFDDQMAGKTECRS